MKKFLLIFALTLLVVPFVVSAQEEIVDTICDLFQTVKTIVAAVGFGIAVILLIVAGIKYMTAAGDDTKSGDAKKGIINALIGLVVVAAAVFIIGLAQGLVSGVSGDSFLDNPCDEAVEEAAG
jgi:hypothetical protein